MNVILYINFIAMFGGRHEDLFDPENSFRPRETWMIWIEQIFVSLD